MPGGLLISKPTCRNAYGLTGTVWGLLAGTRLPFWLRGAFIGGLILLPVAFVAQAGAALPRLAVLNERA